MIRYSLILLGSLCIASVSAESVIAQAFSTCRVSAAQYQQLRDGMSYQRAVQVLGCRGTEMSSSSIAGYSTVMYGWDGSGQLGANMNAMFQNGNLVMKSQFGLR